MEKKIMKSLLILMVVFLIMGVLPQSGMAQNPSDNPVLLHRWSFNGSSDPGTWPSDPNDPAHPCNDSVGNANAALFGTAKITDNALDLSANTPGTNEVTDPNNSGWAAVSMASTLSFLTDGFTIEAWVYLDAHSNSSRILDCGELNTYDEIWLCEGNPDGINGGYYNDAFDGETTFTEPVAVGAWHHMVYTSSKTVGEAKLYLDGTLAASAAIATAPSDLSPLTVCYLGRCYIPGWATGGLLKGKIDEMRIYGEMMTFDRVISNRRCGPDAMDCTLGPITCQEVLDAGYSLPYDFNGDCSVDVADSAMFIGNWAKCIDPSDENCDKVLPDYPTDDPVLLHRWSFNGSSDPATWPSDPNDPAHPCHDSVGGAGAALFGTAKITDNTLDLSTNTPHKNEVTDPNSGWATVGMGGTLSSLTDGFTVEVWFYLHDWSTYGRVLDCGETNQWNEIFLSEVENGGHAGGFDAGFYKDGYDGDIFDHSFTPLVYNTWHHAVYTRSKSLHQAVLYLDGEPYGTIRTPDTPIDLAPADLQPLTCYLGRCYVPGWAVGGLLKGQIDEMRVYGDMMSKARARTNYLCGPEEINCPLVIGCQDVLDEGFSLTYDFNSDCRVNLEDFAQFAAEWLRCIVPTEEGCEKPWQ